jgi:hypothetical protein
MGKALKCLIYKQIIKKDKDETNYKLILMIRPAFRMNEQTAVNNYYQKVLDELCRQP